MIMKKPKNLPFYINQFCRYKDSDCRIALISESENPMVVHLDAEFECHPFEVEWKDIRVFKWEKTRVFL